jgi:3-phosphoshikimate 1-carboxyvinyltransferase
MLFLDDCQGESLCINQAIDKGNNFVSISKISFQECRIFTIFVRYFSLEFLQMDLKIYPPEDILEATIALPLSKSMSARALIMNALIDREHLLAADEVADCDDTHAMRNALAAPSVGTVNIGPAGTAMRFLTAYYAATEGSDVTLDGSERMRRRPIGVLVDALRALGADIEYAGEEGFPPLRIKGKRLHGGELTINAGVSSQYISALMMVAPTFEQPLHLIFDGEPASLPYIKMTAEMMSRRGADVELTRDDVTVKPGLYTRTINDIEPDRSAASYWYEIAALTAGWVTLTGVKDGSLQGDAAIEKIFPQLGVLTEYTDEGAELSATPDLYGHISLDMSDTPDVVQTVVVTACVVGIPFQITGVKSLRIKETDRLAALCLEAEKLGCKLTVEHDNVISWDGQRQPVFGVPEFDTYDDHRMAMAFAPVSVFVPGIIIRNAEVVSKSYPGYWDDLRSAGFTVVDRDEDVQFDQVETEE